MSIYGAILIQMLLSFKIFSHHTPNFNKRKCRGKGGFSAQDSVFAVFGNIFLCEILVN